MIPHPCGVCQRNVGSDDKALQCDRYDLWIHCSCNGVKDEAYALLQKNSDDWFCKNCVVLSCGKCEEPITDNNTINCEKCNIRIHVNCAAASPLSSSSTVIQATNCTWLCPQCNHNNLASFFSNRDGIYSKNPFEALSDNFKVPKKPHRNFFNNRDISMVSININGIRGKKSELQAYLDTKKPDLVALQETKIDSSIKSNELIPDDLDYDIYRKDRNDKGGGIMLLVKTCLYICKILR